MTPLLQASSLIDGERRASSTARVVEILDPANGEALGHLVESTSDDVDAAVAAADRSFRSGAWSALPVTERAAVLRRTADLIEARSGDFAELEARTTGIPIAQVSARQIPGTVAMLRYFAADAEAREPVAVERSGVFSADIRRDPAGVAALISPWNSPIFLSTLKVAAALAYGNSVVLKPSEFTPFGPMMLAEVLMEAGVPMGTVNVVNGPGGLVGARLTAHGLVRRISFTGGNLAGEAVMSAGAKRLVPVTTELGGKSPVVVLASADLPRAVDGVLAGIYSTNGQQCYAGSRLIVHAEVATSFLEALLCKVAQLRVGHPLDVSTEIGPLAHRAHLAQVESKVEHARAQGAEVLLGGSRPDRFAAGNFFEPTVVSVQDTAPAIWREEVFGPVLTVITARSTTEAIDLANDTRFGLTAYGWATGGEEIEALGAQLRAGQVWINTPLIADPRLPFGGIGASGVGREGADDSWRFYTDTRVVGVATPATTNSAPTTP